MGASFIISPVRTQEDIAVIARLFRAYADSLSIDLSYQNFSSELADLPGKYAPPMGELFLARDKKSEPIGCMALRPLSDGICEMKRLYVLPAARGMQLGKALIEAATQVAVQVGYYEVRLDTLPSMTQAIALYRQAGFDEIAPYYDTPITGTLFFAKKLT